MQVLVVGSAGFVGQALVARLLAEGHQVEAWDRRAGDPREGLTTRRVDLLGPGPLPLPGARPWDAAFHLAAHSVPGSAWTRDLVMENLGMTARVFDHLAEHARGCRAIFASSGFVYAPSPDPLREDDPLGSLHPYAVSKHLGETWALSRREALKVFVVRPFNQVGPNMAPGLLVPDLLDRIRAGEEPIRMQGRDDLRDFLDIRDAMDAYIAMLTASAPSGRIWNLCSGRGTSVSSLVRSILDACGSRAEIVFGDPNREALLGDPSRLMADTGWRPARSLEETARAIVQGSL